MHKKFRISLYSIHAHNLFIDGNRILFNDFGSMVEKTNKKCVTLEKRKSESAPGRPKPFRAKVEYSNQLKSYEKSKAFFMRL